MTTKQLGSIYVVDAKFFNPALLKNYRATLPDTERRCKVVKVKVLGLIAGSRSYECQVVGIADKLRLSSKSLVVVDATASHQGSNSTTKVNYESGSAGDTEESESDEDEVAEDDAVDAATDEVSLVEAKDWRSVADFEDPLISQHPNFDIDCPGRLRVRVAMTPCDLFLTFFPMALVETAFPSWRAHAEANGRKGLENLDKKMFMRFLSLLLRMAVSGLRRRALNFSDAVVSTTMTQRLFENLLYTVRDVGFPQYEEGQPLTDGRIATANDPLRQVRRFADDLQQHWQEVYVPGSLLVVDETMVGWTGATNVHITVLPNKPTDKGVCLKSACDAHTRVMVSFEFVESRQEQEQKRYVEEGKSAAVTLRLTEPWHHKGPRVVLADAWFGGILTAVALLLRGLFCIVNVKLQTKHFCKRELWADARGNRRTHERNDRAYRELKLKVNGKEAMFTGAFHMDRRPMTLLATAGSSREAPPVMRRRVYMSDDGDLVRWVGELQQPNVHYLYRSFFNAVDVHNKLSVGPRSVSSVCVGSLPLKLWLSFVAIAETNAYLLYARHHKLTSEQYCHADFKADLEKELLKRAQEDAVAVEEEAGVSTRRSEERVRGVASGDPQAIRSRMPDRFKGHALVRDTNVNRICMMCGSRTKTVCGCGRAICGAVAGVNCWAWHLDAVASGAVDEQPLRWARGKRSRE
jgi:hypothetical protein